MLDCLSPAANNLWALRRKPSQACPCFAGGVVAGISPILREAREPCDSQNPDFAGRLKIAINEIWDAQVLSYVGDHYVIQNAAWDATVAPGQSISFGFNADWANVHSVPANYVLSGVSINDFHGLGRVQDQVHDHLLVLRGQPPGRGGEDGCRVTRAVHPAPPANSEPGG
jgi:hypothetical protein